MPSKELTYLQDEGPFSVYKKRKKESQEPVSDIDTYKKVVIQALENYQTKQRKPVRWNWFGDSEGAFKLGTSLQPSYRMLDTYSKIKTGKSIYDDVNKTIRERDYVDGWNELAKGVETGEHQLRLSLGQLLFAGTDLLANTNFASKFTELMNDPMVKPEEPETWRGDLVSIMTQFGVPGSLVAKIVNRAAKIGPVMKATQKMGTSKASKVAQRVVKGGTVVGATDLVASPDVRREGTLFVEPEDTSKLKGRKKALAMFRNKIRYGVEGTLVGGLFPLGGKAIQQTYKYGVKPIVTPATRYGLRGAGYGIQGTAKLMSGITYGGKRTSKYLFSDNPLVQSRIAKNLAGVSKNTIKKIISPITAKLGYQGLPPLDQWRLFQVTSPLKSERIMSRVDSFLSAFRSYGKMPKDIQGVSEQVKLFITSRARKIDKLLEGMEKRAHSLARKFENRYDKNNTSRPLEKIYLDDAVDYLSGKKKLSSLNKDLRPLALELKKDINKILTEFGKNLPKGTRSEPVADLRKALTGRVDNYLVKSFATFTNPRFTSDPKIRKNARDWIANNVIAKNRDLRELTKSEFKGDRNRHAEQIVNNILARGQTANVNPVKILQNIGTKDLRRDQFAFLKTGEELPDVIRKLLGEEKDLKAQVLFTVADVNASLATKKGFDMIANIGKKNGWLFTSEDAAKTKFVTPVKIGEIPRLGSMKSELEKLYTSPQLRKVLTETGTPLDGLTKTPIIRQMLQAKSFVQAQKTLYSPQTQVRNVTSASFFALWNGHVGHQASAIDSMRMVIKDIFKAGKGQPIDEVEFSKYVEKLVRLGVYDENIVASELKAIMNNLKDGVIKTENGLYDSFVKAGLTEKVSRLYAGGDNLWKGYGYEFFKSDLTRALRTVDDVENYFKTHNHPFSRKNLMTGETKGLDEALDEAAAFMLRNTYPTYSKVPPVIQGLRNIPIIGNFVAFPSEMLRTGTTSIAMSLKNIASDNPVLREMGYKNLIGGYLALKGIGTAGHAVANFVTGNSTEQWEAYKRSSAAPWDKNSNLIGITPWKNGESAAINFSYFSPYDVLENPIQAAMTMADKQNIAKDQIDDYVMSLMFAEDGPIMELLQPFLSPAIYYERIQDVNPGNFLTAGRGGKTAEGNMIYSPTDNIETRFNKSLAYMIKGIEPGLISSGRKIKDALQGDVTGAGKPAKLQDEILALLTGTRIIRIDVKKDLRWVAANTNRLLRAADETEKFYKSKDYMDRPPSIMVDEFNQMQEEAFKIQRDLYMKIKDMQMLDLSRDKIENILIDSGVNKQIVFNLMDGQFTPIKFSRPRFERKIEDVKGVAKEKTEKSKNYMYGVKESFLFPEDKLWNVHDKWADKKFFPEGYKPEEQGAVTNDKGNVVRDERGKIKKEPTFLQKAIPKIKNLVVPGSPYDQKSQTTLPPTPGVNPQAVAQAPQQAGATGLSYSENALLSNEEKAIKLRQKGLA